MVVITQLINMGERAMMMRLKTNDVDGGGDGCDEGGVVADDADGKR